MLTYSSPPSEQVVVLFWSHILATLCCIKNKFQRYLYAGMIYQQFQPHHSLSAFIDAYWTVTGNQNESCVNRIMPDGCVDIIFNLGGDFISDNGNFCMKNGMAYLVGTMTQYKETIVEADTNLVGIRFKPAGFSAFYRFASLHECTDISIEFEEKSIPVIRHSNNNQIEVLDHFFLRRKTTAQCFLAGALKNIYQNKGQITVHELARRQFTTSRQLERNFKQHIGISPKEFINFVRYQAALKEIQNNSNSKSLSDIAVETGFYDHAHLTNAIKKYTGLLPSQY